VVKRLVTRCCISRLACSRLSGHIEPHRLTSSVKSTQLRRSWIKLVGLEYTHYACVFCSRLWCYYNVVRSTTTHTQDELHGWNLFVTSVGCWHILLTERYSDCALSRSKHAIAVTLTGLHVVRLMKLHFINLSCHLYGSGSPHLYLLLRCSDSDSDNYAYRPIGPIFYFCNIPTGTGYLQSGTFMSVFCNRIMIMSVRLSRQRNET